MTEAARTPARAAPEENAPELLVLGATYCEDTAVTRSRLRALGIPFLERDIDVDDEAAARLREIHNGAIRTPTLVFGGGARILAEPSLTDLDEALKEAGYGFEPPVLVDLRAAPPQDLELLELPAVPRGTVSGERLCGHRSLLFLGHGAGCLACWGYAKRLALLRKPLARLKARPASVVTDHLEAVAGWCREIPQGAIVLADPEGSWKRSAAAVLDRDLDEVMLLVLGEDGRPLAGSFGLEAGELVSPRDAAGWLGHQSEGSIGVWK